MLDLHMFTVWIVQRFRSGRVPRRYHRPWRCVLDIISLGTLGKTDRRTEKVEDTAGVAPLVVVPGNKLDKVLIERNASLDVEDGRGVVAVHVRGDNLVIGPVKDSYGESVGFSVIGLRWTLPLSSPAAAS